MLKDGSVFCVVLPGGGMAGAYTIQCLSMLDRELIRTQGVSFHSQVDAYFCTSTGSIIGGGLVSGMSMDRIWEFYMRGKEYFQYAAPWYIPNKLHIPRYKTTPILDCLTANGPLMNMPMKEIFQRTGKHIMFSTVNKNHKYPLNEFIKSWNMNFADMPMIQAINRSFAASIYFGNINDYIYKIVFGDGGEGDANNPILEAHASICDLYPDKKVKMLNIGTGWYNEDMGFSKACKMSGVQDALKVPMMARNQSAKTAVYWATKAYKRDKNFSFYHLDGKFADEKLDVLDGTDFIIDYKNLAIKTMQEPEMSSVLSFING